jgi:acyl-coenzyme A thioesterase PaaI-like protein
MAEPAAELAESAAERLGRGLAWTRDRPLSPRQAAARRVGEAVRQAIDRLTATSAPAEVLQRAAERMDEVVSLLEGYRNDRQYEGFAESSGAGHGEAFFDWSPVLGLSNPLAPPMRLEVEGQVVVATTNFGSAYEGPPGCVHGGFIAAAFDDVLGLTQSLSGQMGMTGTLTIRYRRPTPLYVEVRFEGRLEEISGRKVTTSGRLYAGDEMTAEAVGVFITVSEEHFASLSDNRRT